MADPLPPDEWWRRLLTGDSPPLPIRQLRHLWGVIPTSPRCKFCNAPYHGVGGSLMRLIGKGPSRLTPQLCRQCHAYASRYLGGTELELTMLFADVRGSTTLAEQISASEFSRLISRFFSVAGEVFVQSGALTDRLVGDQVIGLYVPGFAGRDHRRRAVDAALALSRATGHGTAAGPWIPVGIAVHTGVAFLGAVGANHVATDITVLGDAPNTAARLASAAAAGEILISDAALDADSDPPALERRELMLKGKTTPVGVYVLAAQAGE